MEDVRVDERIILKWVFKKWFRGVEWIDVSEDRDTLWAVTNMIQNFWIS